MKDCKQGFIGLVILSIISIILAGCQTYVPPVSTPTAPVATPTTPTTPITDVPTTPAPVETPQIPISPQKPEIEYSMKSCNYLSPEDILTILSLKDVVFKDTPTAINNSNTKCNKYWTGWNNDVSSGQAIIYDITDLSSEAAAEQSLLGLCKDSQTANIGQYKSCEFGTLLLFGKGNYMVGTQCNGCGEGKNIEFAKLIENRLK